MFSLGGGAHGRRWSHCCFRRLSSTIGHDRRPEYGDFCGGAGAGGKDYTVLRRGGVDLAYKKLLDSEKVASEKVCEEKCESDCGCWGAIYTNLSGGSGMCYKLDFPVRTVVATGDETKMGYFKVRKERRKQLAFGAGVFWGVVGGVGVVGAAAIAGVAYGGWRWRIGRVMIKKVKFSFLSSLTQTQITNKRCLKRFCKAVLVLLVEDSWRHTIGACTAVSPFWRL